MSILDHFKRQSLPKEPKSQEREYFLIKREHRVQIGDEVFTDLPEIGSKHIKLKTYDIDPEFHYKEPVEVALEILIRFLEELMVKSSIRGDIKEIFRIIKEAKSLPSPIKHTDMQDFATFRKILIENLIEKAKPSYQYLAHQIKLKIDIDDNETYELILRALQEANLKKYQSVLLEFLSRVKINLKRTSYLLGKADTSGRSLSGTFVLNIELKDKKGKGKRIDMPIVEAPLVARILDKNTIHIQ